MPLRNRTPAPPRPAQAYYGVLRAQALVRLNEAVVKRAQKELELAQTAFQVGTGPPLDILRAQVQVSNAQVDLIAARNQVETALAELKNRMGVPWTQSFQVIEAAPLPDVGQTLEDLLARAWQQRPELQRFSATWEAQAQNLRTARIHRQPQLVINASYQDFLYSSREVDHEWVIGAQLDAPLFDGNRTRAAVAQAQAELAGVRAQEENLRHNIALEVEQAYLALVDARQRREAAQQSVSLAMENLTASEESYKEGVASLLQVTDAQVELTRAETNRIQAEYDFSWALIALRKAVGDPFIP